MLTTDIKYIKIMTDSQASLQALNANTCSSQLVKDTISALNEVGRLVNRLEIVWIKAHVGHVGNERADELAREAETKEDIDFIISDSWSTYKNNLWAAIYQEWNIRWTSEDRFRLTKIFYPTPTKQKSKRILKLSRKQMTLWIEITTGQNNLNYIQNKINNNISPLCRFCEEEDETFPHILNECPCFRQLRCDILQQMATDVEDWTVDNILKVANTPSIKYALSFTPLEELGNLN